MMAGLGKQLIVFGVVGLGLSCGGTPSFAASGEARSEAASETAAEPLVADRPDFSEGTQTIPRGRIQVEGGVTFERSGSSRAQSFGEVLVRIPTGDRSELRIGVPSYLRVRDDGAKVSGFEDAFLGGKFVLRDGESGGPSVAFLIGSTLPIGSRRLNERKFQPEAVLAASIDLSEKAALSSNIVLARPSSDGERFNQFAGSLSLGYSLNEKWGSYVEVYGFNREERRGRSQSYVNGGLTYLVNNDFQVDARIGRGLSSIDERTTFFGFGAARRF